MTRILFTLLRWLVTLLYLVALVGALLQLSAVDALELTATYGILMLLLWLYERYRTR